MLHVNKNMYYAKIGTGTSHKSTGVKFMDVNTATKNLYMTKHMEL